MFNAFEKNILQRHPNEWKHTQYDRYSRQAAFFMQESKNDLFKSYFLSQGIKSKNFAFIFFLYSKYLERPSLKLCFN